MSISNSITGHLLPIPHLFRPESPFLPNEENELINYHLNRPFVLFQSQTITPKEIYEQVEKICPSTQIFLHGSALPLSHNTLAKLTGIPLDELRDFKSGIVPPDEPSNDLMPIDYDAFYQLSGPFNLEALQMRLKELFHGAAFSFRTTCLTMKIGLDSDHLDLTFGWEVPYIDDTVCVGIKPFAICLLGASSLKVWLSDKIAGRFSISRDLKEADFSWYLRFLCKMTKGHFSDDLELSEKLRSVWGKDEFGNKKKDELLKKGLIKTCKDHLPDTETYKIAFWLNCSAELQDEEFLRDLCEGLNLPENYQQFREKPKELLHALKVAAIFSFMINKKGPFVLREAIGSLQLVFRLEERRHFCCPSVLLKMDMIIDELKTFHKLPEKIKQFAFSLIPEKVEQENLTASPFEVDEILFSVDFLMNNPQLIQLIAPFLLTSRLNQYVECIRHFISMEDELALILWKELPIGEVKREILQLQFKTWGTNEKGWKCYLKHLLQGSFVMFHQEALEYVLSVHDTFQAKKELIDVVKALPCLNRKKAIELGCFFLEKRYHLDPLITIPIDPASSSIENGEIAIYRAMALYAPEFKESTLRFLMHLFPNRKSDFQNLFQELKGTYANYIFVFAKRNSKALKEIANELLLLYTPSGDLQLFSWFMQQYHFERAKSEFDLMEKKPWTAIDRFLKTQDLITFKDKLLEFCRACNAQKFYFYHLLKQKQPRGLEIVLLHLREIESFSDHDLAKLCREAFGVTPLKHSKLVFMGATKKEKVVIWNELLQESFTDYFAGALSDGVDVLERLLDWGLRQTYDNFIQFYKKNNNQIQSQAKLLELVTSIRMCLALHEEKDFLFASHFLDHTKLVYSLKESHFVKLFKHLDDNQIKRLIEKRRDLLQVCLFERIERCLNIVQDEIDWNKVFLDYQPSAELVEKVSYLLLKNNLKKFIFSLYVVTKMSRQKKAGYHDIMKILIKEACENNDILSMQSIWEHFNLIYPSVLKPTQDDALLIHHLARASHLLMTQLGNIYDRGFYDKVLPLWIEMLTFLLVGQDVEKKDESYLGVVKNFNNFPEVRESFIRPLLLMSVVPSLEVKNRASYYYLAALFYHYYFKLIQPEDSIHEMMLENFVGAHTIFKTTSPLPPLVDLSIKMIEELSMKKKMISQVDSSFNEKRFYSLLVSVIACLLLTQYVYWFKIRMLDHSQKD